ncbi:hypothetical protein [Deinococcus sp. UYEF24]
MHRSLSSGLLLLVLLVTSACDRSPVPMSSTPAPVPDALMTGSVSMSPASDVLVGRTLTLNVGTRGWDENLGSTSYYGFAVPPVSSTVIGTDHTYTLTLPRQVSAVSLAPVTWFWSKDPFTQGTCSVQVEHYSDATMKLGMGTLRVLTGGTLTRDVEVSWPPDWQSTDPVRNVVDQGLVYADRAGSVTVQYDCVSSSHFRMKSDTQLSLQAGWNVLVKHSVEEGGTNEGDATYAYELRSRPLVTTGETLTYVADTVLFDAPASHP